MFYARYLGVLNFYWVSRAPRGVGTSAYGVILTCRQVTPHLGYLTNWHSLIQSVQLSLSNTLSGGPDLMQYQRLWLCRFNEQGIRTTLKNIIKNLTKHTKYVLIWLHKEVSLVLFQKLHANACVTWCRLESKSSTLLSSPSQWWHCAQDSSFDQSTLACQRGSQNKEDNCKASSQEMWGNKVSTCHVVKCCWRLKWLTTYGFLSHIQQFCSAFVALMVSWCLHQ